MSLKRIAILTSCALVAWAMAAQTAMSATYSLAPGSGGQTHIGNGLAIPIQQAVPNQKAVFPNLLIPPVPGATVMGTTGMGSQQKLTVPATVLEKQPGQTTVGVKFSNPVVYAVGTNLHFRWPAAAAVFSTGARTGAKTTVFNPATGLTVSYSNPLASKFGGPAQGRIAGAAGGILPAPVTVYIAVFGGIPPCTHPTFGGTSSANNLGCKARLAHAKPSLAKSTGGGNTGVAAIGGPASTTITTPGGTVGPSGVLNLKLGGPVPGPSGTIISAKVTAGMGVGGINNMATSYGFPYTTGKMIIKAATAAGAPETFTLTGSDNRTAMGAGTIQLVAGSVSLRTTSMDNANRGWIRLVLDDTTAKVPALSAPMRAAAAAFMLLVFGYALRRFAAR